MSIEAVIDRFCSRSSKQWEQIEDRRANGLSQSSRSSQCSHQLSLDQKQILINFVKNSCLGLKVEPKKVMDNLLSLDDEQDILDGYMLEDNFRRIVELWIGDGMPHVSGKQLIIG